MDYLLQNPSVNKTCATDGHTVEGECKVYHSRCFEAMLVLSCALSSVLCPVFSIPVPGLKDSVNMCALKYGLFCLRCLQIY